MTFNSSFFESLYPDDLGEKKARERLFVSAQIGCCNGLTEYEWINKAKNDPELMFYASLIGGPTMFAHFAYTVWYMLRRQ